MARLSHDSKWLIQQIGGDVILFSEGDEVEVVRFDPNDGNAAARSQKTIHDSTLLTDEEKCFAHFWSGYFYAHAVGGEAA